MRPLNLKTKIFIDGGDPNETREIIRLLGFLDGQTTNPTLIAKNPDVERRREEGRKFSAEEIDRLYRAIVEEISSLIPDGSVSIEVYAHQKTSANEMFRQGREMFAWIPNAHIKYPITKDGLAAAAQSIEVGMRVNLTLCFTQEQAAAVYAATRGGKKGDIFVSPFVGRLDDAGENGMALVKNIVTMYRVGDGHVETLAVSVRNIDHLLYAIQLESDIVTAPFRILKEWGKKGRPIPSPEFSYRTGNLKEIPYKEIDLAKNWRDFDIAHKLTNQGIDSFANDWNRLSF